MQSTKIRRFGYAQTLRVQFNYMFLRDRQEWHGGWECCIDSIPETLERIYREGAYKVKVSKPYIYGSCSGCDDVEELYAYEGRLYQYKDDGYICADCIKTFEDFNAYVKKRGLA